MLSLTPELTPEFVNSIINYQFKVFQPADILNLFIFYSKILSIFYFYSE